MIHDEREALVVDPGDASPVLQACEALGVELGGILVTHHHNDHVGGVAELTARHAVPVWGPAGESIPHRSVALSGGESLRALGLTFTVIAVPGHTLGHVAYHCPALNAVFCGDTLFSAGCGRLFEGTPSQMLGSLDRLAALDPSTAMYCAHEYTLSNLQFARHVEPGNSACVEYARWCQDQREAGRPTLPSTIGLERTVNPFLRLDSHELLGSLARHAGRSPSSRDDAFALLRQWKDGF